MVHDSWQPLTAKVRLQGEEQGGVCTVTQNCSESASAAFSQDRSAITLRYVNPSAINHVQVVVSLPGGSLAWRIANASQLSHPLPTGDPTAELADANAANDTLHISPQPAEYGPDLGEIVFTAPAQSFVVVEFVKQS